MPRGNNAICTASLLRRTSHLLWFFKLQVLHIPVALEVVILIHNDGLTITELTNRGDRSIVFQITMNSHRDRLQTIINRELRKVEDEFQFSPSAPGTRPKEDFLGNPDSSSQQTPTNLPS